MDGLARSVGDGIGSLFGGAIDAVGGALAGMVQAASRIIPNGLFPVIAITAIVVVGWLLLKR